MSSADMDRCLAMLRYVRNGDYLLTNDINVPRECIYIIRAWLEAIAKANGIDPSIVQELDPYLARLRHVHVGDILMPDDHNAIVDALKKIRDILARLESSCSIIGYERGFNDGVLWCRNNLMPIRDEILIGADIVENVEPSRELKTSVAIGADATLDTGVNVNSDVEIVAQQ